MQKPLVLLSSVLVSSPLLAADPAAQLLDKLVVQSGNSSTESITKKNKYLPISEEAPRTEQLSSAEIAATGATNVTEAVTHRAGVDVQTECSICNAKAITLNNLPGRFTTVLIDGIPIYSAASSVYGLEGIPVNLLDRIEIARGAAMSLVAPEAIAGSVNLVTKKITQNEGSVRAEVSEHGSRKLDYFQGWAGKQSGQYLSINGQLRTHDSVDNNGNGISELSGYDRKLFGLGVGLGELAGWQTRLRIDHVNEKRTGGVGIFSNNFNGIRNNTSGNPFDWSKGVGGSQLRDGWYIPGTNTRASYLGQDAYNAGLAGMAELIDTRRTQGTLISERTQGKDSYRIAAALAEHKQDSFYEGSVYNLVQHQSYLEGRWKRVFNESALTTGVAYKSEQHRSVGTDSAGRDNSGVDNYTYRIPGIFAQYDFFALGGDLEVNLSARHDEHNVFGGITSPRALLSYSHHPEWTSRFALGKGYRAPTTFFEQDHGILDTTRIVRADNLRYETAYNAAYNLTLQTDRTEWSSGITWTQLNDMVKIQSDQVDGGGNPITLLGNVTKPVTFTTVDTSIRYLLTPLWTVTSGLEYTQYGFEQAEEPLAFARPELRAFLGAELESGNWGWRTRATWTGPMDLARFGNYKNNADAQRYNLDGSPKRNTSPAYWLVDTRVSYQLDKAWKVYAGVNNLLNEVQSRKESPLWLDKDGSLDYTHLWGLAHGRHVFIGTEVKF